MKFLGQILYFVVAGITSAEDISSSLCSLTAEDPEVCSNGERSLTKTRNMISALMCPDGENSPNPNCKTRTWPKGGPRTFNWDLKRAIKNYGCNCFTGGSAVQNDFGGVVELPGIQGKPVDEVDAVCLNLAKRFQCFNLDKKNGDIEASCEYNTNYPYHIDVDGNIVCGRKRDPGFIKSGDTCKRALCEMEKEFALSIVPLLNGDPIAFHSDNKRNYDIWSSDQCVRGYEGKQKSTCCGSHSPAGRVSYDPNMSCCTDDGQVMSMMMCV